MEVSVLGPVLVRASGMEVQVGGRQARRILARLALGAHGEVTVGALAQAAWGDHPPATARHTIATYVLRLRRAGLAIRTTNGGYCLDTPTDVEELDLARAAAAAAAAETSVRQWRRALSLWRDRPFVDLDHVPEAVIEAARLEEAVETIREDLLAAELDGVTAADGAGSGSEALNVFRELGHRPTEGTVAYRLAAVARGLGRPKAARRYALLARAAGEQSSTRSTVAMAEIDLGRLDLDDHAWSTAAEHLSDALDVTDPEADRWVLVEALEAVARLAVGLGRAEAAPLLDSSARIRREIHQPVAPTEAADLSATVARSRGHSGEPASPEASVAYQTALTLARQLATPVPMPSQRRRPHR